MAADQEPELPFGRSWCSATHLDHAFLLSENCSSKACKMHDSWERAVEYTQNIIHHNQRYQRSSEKFAVLTIPLLVVSGNISSMSLGTCSPSPPE